MLGLPRASSSRGKSRRTHPIGERSTPHIDGALVTLDCVVTAEIAVGDHFMVVGAVDELVEGVGSALLFRGRSFGKYDPIEETVAAARSDDAA
ncbi:flavin reductase [Microbacterium rhizophilus]|uniref:flavin reductase n=1 Tax=Microbacterium rhizophilus TaxID=3138934 RepID=UPI0035C90840